MIACKCPVCRSDDSKDKRLRSSILIKSPSTVVVIDTTPDFRTQMLRSGVDHIDAVLFTHSHKDHIAGLDDIRAFNFFSKKPIPIFANQETSEALQRDFYYAFADTKYPGVPELDLHPIDDQPFMVGDLHFIPIRVKHLHMHVTGFRIGDFTYITDANHIDDQELLKIMGSKILVLNALRKQKHLSHFTLEEAIAVAQQVGAEQTYFTHISHQLGFHAEVSRELPEGIHLAYDGLTVYLD